MCLTFYLLNFAIMFYKGFAKLKKVYLLVITESNGIENCFLNKVCIRFLSPYV